MITHKRLHRQSDFPQRRGVLLLVVLSMLTLFMMLGAAYLVVATRSRETAKSFARLSLRSDNVRLPHSQLFDTVMLRVLRGSTNPTGRALSLKLAFPELSGVLGDPSLESILADKYGYDTLRGYAKALGDEGANRPVFEQAPLLTIPAFFPTSGIPADFEACDLNGRVITVLGPGREPSSHRILRATDNGNKYDNKKSYRLQIDNQPRNRPFQAVPASTDCEVLINGREFSGDGTPTSPNEPWDGFDDQNLFLSHVAPADMSPDHSPSSPSISSSVVKKAGYLNSGTAPAKLSMLTTPEPSGFSYGADNDNDGVPDGFYLDFGLPTIISPNGDRVLLHASVLVVDLDGRINVNAHGSLSQMIYPANSTNGTHQLWPSGPTVPLPGEAFTGVPLGSGYGPPEVAVGRLFADDGVLYPRKYRTYGNPPKPIPTANDKPIENPAAYLQFGVNALRLSGKDPEKADGRYGPGSRFFSIGNDGVTLSNTPQTDTIEGRYGGGDVASFWPPVARFTSAQVRLANEHLPGSARNMPKMRPGRRYENDAASAVNDHRSALRPDSEKADPLRTERNEGVPPLWWNATAGKDFNWTKTVGNPGKDFLPRAVYNAPPDLHGRMKSVTVDRDTGNSGVVPRTLYSKAEWSTGDDLDVETRDDPYELRLDLRAPRNSWLSTASTNTNPFANLFNLSELENVLRPYDIDSAKLPPRMEALLGSFCEESRLRLTTDSWDTTVITGTAAKLIADSQRALWRAVSGDPKEFYSSIGTTNGSLPFTGLLGREIARGERFDLNRPLTSEKPTGEKYDPKSSYYLQRQAYFQDLYLLLWLLSNDVNGTKGFDADKCAQWAANVVEFRDADSTMTPFEYDPDPSKGWGVDGDSSNISEQEASADSLAKFANDSSKWVADLEKRRIVIGAERPEVVITETSAWEDDTPTTGELFVMLHRPWNAIAYAQLAANTTPVEISGEPVHSALDSYSNNNPPQAPENKLDLGRKAGGSRKNNVASGTYPVWRLRIVANGKSSYVRMDTTSDSGDDAILKTTEKISDTTTPRIPADGWLCLSTNIGSSIIKIAAPAEAAEITPFTLPGKPALSVAGPPRPAKIYLERLADPDATVASGSDAWTRDVTDAKKQPSLLSNAELTGMALYQVVDEADLQIVNRIPAAPGAPAVPPSKTTRDASGLTAFWKSDFPEVDSAATVTLVPLTPGTTADDRPLAFHWPNRPLNGSPELLLVPRQNSQNLLKNYTKPSLNPPAGDDNYLVGLLRSLSNPPLLDAVTVPTRFAGIHGTTSDPFKNLESLAGIDQLTTPVNQLSAYREPGRVNLNTVVADDVWNAVVAGSLVKPNGDPDGPPRPRVDDPDPQAPKGAKFSLAPAKSTRALLALSGTAPATASPIEDTNERLDTAAKYAPVHSLYTATRLANTATTRSHLFGVWITLRESLAPRPTAGNAIPGDPDSVRYHRAFYVIDRSIPVAHEPGRDHNVWDAVLLRRVIE